MINIYCVTNRILCNDFYKHIEEIAQNNVSYMIIREKDLNYNELYILTKRIKEITENYNTKIIINSEVKIYKELNLYGVHLSFNNFKENHNNIKGIKGVSVHSYREALEAQKLGADYIVYGHVFYTKCKEGLEPRGLDELTCIARDIKIPVVAIGGINNYNYRQVLKAGASGIAIMSSIMECDDVSEYIKSFNI